MIYYGELNPRWEFNNVCSFSFFFVEPKMWTCLNSSERMSYFQQQQQKKRSLNEIISLKKL